MYFEVRPAATTDVDYRDNIEVEGIELKLEAYEKSSQRRFEVDPIYDICLPYHVISERRRYALHDVFLKIASPNLTIYHPSLDPEIDPDDIYTKEYLILQCKVVLNIHSLGTSVLETHRINHLLALGKCIISEDSPVDPYLDQLYSDVVHFTPVGDLEPMIEISKQFLASPDRLKACELRSLRRYNEIMADTSILEIAMNEALESDELSSIYL
jgi:hypothetical protein